MRVAHERQRAIAARLPRPTIEIGTASLDVARVVGVVAGRADAVLLRTRAIAGNPGLAVAAKTAAPVRPADLAAAVRHTAAHRVRGNSRIIRRAVDVNRVVARSDGIDQPVACLPEAV